MAIRWSRQMEESLIALVYDNDILWDKTFEGRGSSTRMSDIWAEVAKELRVTKNQARNKWRTLQTQFTKELAKLPKTKSGDAASTSKISWPHFDAMSFLLDNVTNASSGNIPDSIYDSDDNIDQVLNSTKNVRSQASSSAGRSSYENVEASMELDDPTSQADWQFLLSLLPFMDKIDNEAARMQFRVEVYFMLFNFFTKNKLLQEPDESAKLIAEAVAQQVPQKVPQPAAQPVPQHVAQPVASKPVKVERIEKQPAAQQAAQSIASEPVEVQRIEKQPVAQQVAQPVASEPVKVERKEKQHDEDDDIVFVLEQNPKFSDVKPSLHLQKYLKNPLCFKKEQ